MAVVQRYEGLALTRTTLHYRLPAVARSTASSTDRYGKNPRTVAAMRAHAGHDYTVHCLYVFLCISDCFPGCSAAATRQCPEHCVVHVGRRMEEQGTWSGCVELRLDRDFALQAICPIMIFAGYPNEMTFAAISSIQ